MIGIHVNYTRELLCVFEYLLLSGYSREGTLPTSAPLTFVTFSQG